MKKALLLTIIVMMASATAAVAALPFEKDAYGYFVFQVNSALKPIVDGRAQSYCIPAAYKGLVDTNGVQSVTLEKKHIMRKGACGFMWQNDYIRQQGKELATSQINLCWPLLYETEGTQWVLSIVYQTNPATPNPEGRSVRVHKERYVWTVDWKAADFSDFRTRLLFFANMPAGACELFAIPPLELRKILWVLDAFGCKEFLSYDAGITELMKTPPTDPLYQQNLQIAADKAALLEQIIDEDSCIDICGPYCANLPSPFAVGILNNCTVPAGSVLLTDFYYAAHAAGLLQD